MKVKQITLGELICEAKNLTPQVGQYKGMCGACGRDRNNLLKSNYRDTFSLTEYLHESDYICPYCSELYENQGYRYSNWLCDNNRFIKLKKHEVIEALIRQKEVPFALYTTTTYQRQGWIQMIIKGINYSTEFLVIGYDMILFQISRNMLLDFITRLKFLKQAEISTSELLTGKIGFHCLKNIPEEKRREHIKFLSQNKKNIKWLWLIEFSKNSKALQNI